VTDACLPDWLARRAVTHASHPALLAGSVSWTFAELDDRATDAARRLAAHGVVEGERVALLARNGPAFVVTVHSVSRLGAVLVPLNVRLTPVELAWQLADARVDLLLHDAAHGSLAAAAAAQVAGVRKIEVGPDGPEGAAAAVISPREKIALDSPQGIVYTSGTTGRSKGVLLTYGNYWWSAVGSVLHLGHCRDDRWLAMLPLFHVGGLAILFRSVIAGVPVVLHEAFDPAGANHAIAEERVTLVSVVANMLRRMLDEQGERPYPPTLRCILLGGGPAPGPLLEDCLRRGVPVSPTYGLTETCSQVATLLPEDLARHLGSAGRPLPTTEIRIERDGRPLPPGEVGEIVVRGPTVSPGYAGAAPEGAIRADGWLRTGDLGRLDGEGYLYVLDRRDDLIISGGENVSPAEVEAVLLLHPAVEDAAVVGVPDEQWGAIPVAYVKLRLGWSPTEQEVLAFCAARLAAFKRPRRIEWVDSLPRNAAGKLLRRELRTDA
jgi:O-succinylbenzoic acid--CoA ligase